MCLGLIGRRQELEICSDGGIGKRGYIRIALELGLQKVNKTSTSAAKQIIGKEKEKHIF
jgi:hypothetical protein